MRVRLLLVLGLTASCYPRVRVVEEDASSDTSVDAPADTSDVSLESAVLDVSQDLQDVTRDTFDAGMDAISQDVMRDTLAETTPSESSVSPPDGGTHRYLSVAGGFQHTCALRDDRQVFCWGAFETNTQAILGSGFMGSSLGFLPVSGLANVSRLSVGSFHSCAIGARMSVMGTWCWGLDTRGEASGTSIPRGTLNSPLFIPLGPETAVDVGCGSAFTCVRTAENRVLCWGDNTGGQQGSPADMAISTPHVVAGTDGAVELAVGEKFACVRTGDRNVLCWGSYHERDTPRAPSPIDFSRLYPGETISSLRAGKQHVCARTSRGRLVCWGMNFSNQFGMTPTPNRMDNIADEVLGVSDFTSHFAVGFTHCVVEATRTRCWGRNDFGQLANRMAAPGGAVSTALPVQTSTGMDFLGMERLSEGGQAGTHMCGITTTGSVVCWGRNQDQQVGRPRSETMQMTVTGPINYQPTPFTVPLP